MSLFRHLEIPEAKTVEEKLDVIILHLNHMDRRDRMRMWGGFIHSLFAIIPLLFFVWSTWYLYNYADELIGAMMQRSAQNAAESTGDSYENAIQQLQNFFSPKE